MTFLEFTREFDNPITLRADQVTSFATMDADLQGRERTIIYVGHTFWIVVAPYEEVRERVGAALSSSDPDAVTSSVSVTVDPWILGATIDSARGPAASSPSSGEADPLSLRMAADGAIAALRHLQARAEMQALRPRGAGR